MIRSNAELDDARQLAAQRRWREAFAAFGAADRVQELDAPGLEEWSVVAYWAGELEVAIEARERAFALRAAAGERRQAARNAMYLAKLHGDSLRVTVAGAWRAKAERMLHDEGPCGERAELTARLASRAFTAGEYERAEEMARTALDMALEHGAADAEAFARHVLGQILIYRGEIDAGFDLVDEATAEATSGRLSPMVAGTIYCWTISLCRDLADVKRAADWTQVASRWCERNGVTGFPGVCRIHRSELRRLHGAFAEAEQEALEAAIELERHSPRTAGEAFAELAEVRLARGMLDAAADAVKRAVELSCDAQPVRSLVLHQLGDTEAALRQLKDSYAAEPDKFWRGRMLPPLIEMSIADGDLAGAEAAAAELRLLARDYRSELFHAQAAMADGMLAAARGEPEPATASYRAAIRTYNSIDAPFEAAKARAALAAVLLAANDTGRGLDEATTALEAFERLGAALAAAAARRLIESATAPAAAPEVVERTFMFTDIVRSTALLTAVGDEAWHDLLTWHDRALRASFAEHGGEEVDHAGDGFLVSFASPAQALACATAIQRLLSEHRRAAGFAPRVRIGVHGGTAAKAARAYRGRTVHEAARIAALAGADEILASCATWEAAHGDRAPERVRVETLRGIKEPVELTSVAWR